MAVLDLKKHVVELLRRTSCDLPSDIENALSEAEKQESGRAKSTLTLILRNVAKARKNSVPLCQDTGTVICDVHHGANWDPLVISQQIQEAIGEATESVVLRPNTVHPLTGKNQGSNLGIGAPVIHFHRVKEDWIKIRMMLKGGGSENCGIQYSLPDGGLGAARDLSGIKRCLLDAVVRAQGFGCAPGILGVGIGGDRQTSYEESKIQLFRFLNDENENPILSQLEKEMFKKINLLGIGPMGFGGKTSLLGVKAGIRHRHPASFFVSISYMCWACRRRSLTINEGLATFE